jgi:hypothetical protein
MEEMLPSAFFEAFDLPPKLFRPMMRCIELPRGNLKWSLENNVHKIYLHVVTCIV